MAESDGEAVTRAIERATDKSLPALSVDERNAIVSICKISRQNVGSAFNALQNRLTSSHVQTRLLALEICAVLMPKSGVFRTLMAQNLTQFLGACMGTLRDRVVAMPGQESELREQALKLLSEWAGAYGHRHPQLQLALVYLKHTLRLTFPDVPRATSSEERRRRGPATARSSSSLQHMAHDLETELAALRAALVGSDNAIEFQDWEDVEAASTSRTEESMWPPFDPATVDLDIAGPILEAIMAKEREVRTALASGTPVIDAASAVLHRLDDRRFQELRRRWSAARGSPTLRTRSAPAAHRPEQGSVQGGRPHAEHRPADDWDPYADIQDPAAPKPGAHILGPSRSPRRVPVTVHPQKSSSSSSLPEDVRRRLAAQAPTLPTGPHTHYWDSHEQRSLTSGVAEVYNHWGAVDISKELPDERLDDVFMVPAGLIERHARENREQPAQVQGSASPRRMDSGKRPLVAGSMTRQEEQAFNAAVLGENDAALAESLGHQHAVKKQRSSRDRLSQKLRQAMRKTT